MIFSAIRRRFTLIFRAGDLYQTLSLGATCHIFSKKLFTFPMLLLWEMERVGVTAINWATSAFHCGKLGCTEQVRAAHAAQSRSRR